MEFFTIKNFRPVEVKEDSTDQDRSVLRLCEGVLPVPQGALSSGPQWQLLWGIDNLATRAETLLAGADPTKAHLLQLSRLDRTFVIVWSLALGRALGFFEVKAAPGENDLDSTTGILLTAPATAPWRDKDPVALWFASPAADRWLLGNGIDANLEWLDGVLAVFGPSTLPSDPYDLGRHRIPPCTCFRLNSNGHLFAAGNTSEPMRVWITEHPNAAFPFFTGIVSLTTSFVDVRPNGGATRITGLSVFQNYVTVHTDRAPVNLYAVNTTEDGWKCEQGSSAANASAINPACVGDTSGDMAFYLGADLEVYTDQAIRSGPPEKRGARDQEIVTAQASGVWNRDMQRSLATFGYSAFYDRQTRLFWIFARSVFAGRTMLWVYNERTKTCAGPIHYPDSVAGTALLGLDLPTFREGGISGLQVGTTFGVG